MGWEIFRFGRIYLDGKPVRIPSKPTNKGNVPVYKETKTITIGDTFRTDAITWVKPDGLNLFIADRILLDRVSYNDLDASGLATGRTMFIDGHMYLCRLLRDDGICTNQNEWDRILDATTEDDDLWHWNHIYSLCAHTDKAGYREGECSVRGLRFAKDGHIVPQNIGLSNCGLRPVLEPVYTNSPPPSGEVKLLDDQRFIVSQLQGISGKMFYPQLLPIKAGVFNGIPAGSIIKMYSVLADGKPVCITQDTPITLQSKTDISLTDKFYGEEFLIPWCISNGIAIASRPLVNFC